MTRNKFFATMLALGVAAKAKAAFTLARSTAFFVPAITTDTIRVIRAGGNNEEFVDIGPSIKIERLTNPTRTVLNVDWTKDPNTQPSGGWRLPAPRQLTLTGTNQYIVDATIPLPMMHLVFVNGFFFCPPDDYTVSGGTITALHPAMLDPTAKVMIVY